MKLLTILRALVLTAGVVASTSVFAADLKSRMDRFDRLDQMDRQQMQSHLDAAMSCISARNYACSEQRLKQAEQVAVDSKDRDAVARTRKALVAEKALAAKEEAVRQAEASQLRIAEACANSCLIAREYDRCVRGLMQKSQCSYEEAPQYSASSGSGPNVAAEIQAALGANMAAAGRMANAHNNMVNNINEQARQRAEMEQQQRRQQQAQEQQRRQQQLAQQQQNHRAAEEQRVNAQRQRAEEAARNDQAAREREQRIVQQEQARTQTKAPAETRTQLAQAAPTSRDSSTGGGKAASATKPSLDAEGFDESGCIESVGWCSTSQTVERKGKRQILRFTNTCPFRVYGDFINGRAGGADRGADSVRAGATHTWSTEEGDGRSFIRVIGSRSGSSDWVCAGKYKNAGFAAGDSTLERR